MENYQFVIHRDHPSLDGHFLNNPIVPGVVILDHVLLGLKQHLKKRSLRFGPVKFKSVLRPDEGAEIQYQLKSDKCTFLVLIKREDEDVVIANGTLILYQEVIHI